MLAYSAPGHLPFACYSVSLELLTYLAPASHLFALNCVSANLLAYAALVHLPFAIWQLLALFHHHVADSSGKCMGLPGILGPPERVLGPKEGAPVGPRQGRTEQIFQPLPVQFYRCHHVTDCCHHACFTTLKT